MNFGENYGEVLLFKGIEIKKLKPYIHSMKKRKKDKTPYFIIFLFLLLLNTGNPMEPVFYQPKQIPVISRIIQRKIIDNPEEKIKAWVYFTDKNVFSREEYELALNKYESHLNQRVKWRRKKVRLKIADFHDLPLCEEYVQMVLSTGVKLRVRSRWLNAISIEGKIDHLRQISILPFVRRIDLVLSGTRRENYRTGLDQDITGLPGDSTYYGNSYTQLAQINAITAHQEGYLGQGIIVLMLDTGFFKEHEAIPQEQIIAEWDFINNDGNTQNEEGDPPSQHNHGTYTLSVLGGLQEGVFSGVAPAANFLLAKTEDISQEQPIEEDWYVAGLEWGENLGADVCSSSLGYIDWYSPEDLDGNTAVTTIAVDLAVQRGLICVTAAGNEGQNGIIAPADADSVIACGAVNALGEIAPFSSRGPTADGRIKPEVVAMGVLTFCATTSSTNAYTYKSGTSLSTPLVGGAIAVLLSAHPDWTPMMVREALLNTASNASSPDNTYGWGLIDLYAAINYPFLKGDLDRDGIFTVTDIVNIVNIILNVNEQPDEYELWASDVNSDGEINVSDIIAEVILIFSSNP